MNHNKMNRRLCYGLTALLMALTAALTLHLSAQAQTGVSPPNEIRVKLPIAAAAVTLDEQSGVAHFTGVDLQYLEKSGEPAIPYQVIKVLLPPDADLATLVAPVDA